VSNELLTKIEIARELSPDEPLTVRSVERYIQLANVAPVVKGSGRGKQAKFSRADVEKIKAAYHAATDLRNNQSTALTAPRAAMMQPAALVAQLIESNASQFQSLQAALDTWPVWMNRSDAITRSGLPAAWLDAGARSGELAHVGEGRGRRFHRDDVREFAARVRDAKFLKKLLKKKS
jgi:hypothetical protein